MSVCISGKNMTFPVEMKGNADTLCDDRTGNYPWCTNPLHRRWKRPSPRDKTFLAKRGACMWSNTSCSHL